MAKSVGLLTTDKRLVEFFNVPEKWDQKIYLVDEKDIEPYNAGIEPHKEWSQSKMDKLNEVWYFLLVFFLCKLSHFLLF